MTDPAPTDRVRISPRHAADSGPGERLHSVLGPLIQRSGWRYAQQTATSHVMLDSPCHSVFIDIAPTRTDETWWRIRHHEPYWQALFSGRTPTEAIAAFVHALPQFLGDDRHTEQLPLDTRTFVEIADCNGWTMATDGTATVFTSSDGHGILTHTPDAETRWTVRHVLPGDAGTRWSADCTRATPPLLVAQFFAALVGTTPAERAFGSPPSLAHNASSAAITRVHDTTLTPLTRQAPAPARQPPGTGQRTPTTPGRR